MGAALKNDPAQLAVKAEAEINKPKKRAGDKISESRWLDVVAKDLEIQNDARKLASSIQPPTQLLKREIVPEVKSEFQSKEETAVKEEPIEEGEIKDESSERDSRSR